MKDKVVQLAIKHGCNRLYIVVMGGPGSGKTSFVNHMKKDPILRANPIVIPMWHRGIGKCSICGIRNNDAFELPGYNRRVIVMETECVCGWVLKQTNPSWATYNT